MKKQVVAQKKKIEAAKVALYQLRDDISMVIFVCFLKTIILYSVKHNIAMTKNDELLWRQGWLC